MLKRWKLLTALFAVLALVAAACGGDDAGSDTTAATTTTTTEATTTTTEATTTTTAAPGETTTTTAPPTVRADADLVIWTDAQRQPVIDQFAQEFAAENGITAAVQGLNDLNDRLADADKEGAGPDLAVIAHDRTGGFVQDGVIQPIDISSVADDFLPVSVDAFTFEGKTYGLPYSVTNIALIRNADLVPETPATWEELVTIAEGLVADGTVEFPLALQENGNGDPFHNYPLFTAFGGYVFGDGGRDKNDLGIDSEGGLAAARAFAEWSESGLINIDIQYQDMIDIFSEGRAPFAITGPWATGEFANAGVNYVVEPIPPVQGGTPQVFVSVQGFVKMSNGQNPLIAETFLLDKMASAEAQLALFEVEPRPPALTAAFEQVSDDPDVQGFQAAGAVGAPMPLIPEMGSVWSAWTDAYELIFTGSDPEQAFKDAANQIRNLIASG